MNPNVAALKAVLVEYIAGGGSSNAQKIAEALDAGGVRSIHLQLGCAAAIVALEKLVSAASIGDFIYNIREQEGAGWDGPRVTAWSQGCVLARDALVAAGVTVPAPFPRPSMGTPEAYYSFPDPSEVASGPDL